MSLKETTKETLTKALLAGLLGAAGYILQSLAKEAAEPFAKHVLPAISSTTLLWLCLLLLLTNLVTGTWLLFLIFGDKAKGVRRRYDFLKERGFWKHRNTGEFVCGNCLLVGIESPLAAMTYSDSHGDHVKTVWECGRKDCKTDYPLAKEDVDAIAKSKPVS